MRGSPSTSTPRPRGRPRKTPRILANSPTTEAGPGSSSMTPDFAHKVNSTFTSSLDIAVQGASTVNSTKEEEDARSATTTHVLATATSSTRPHRKSKTDALAALTNRSRSSSIDEDDFTTHDALPQSFNGNGSTVPIPVKPTLDLSNVATTSPRNITSLEAERPFGLKHCPIFYPTTEEFKDPMAYVQSISERAKEFGICKIIPPEGWNMPFVTDTESFRFHTRLQRLNSIEASSRAKVNFLEQLYQFHRQQGNPRVSVPTINHKPMDLWLLRKEVHNRGGYDAVNKKKLWSEIGRTLGYTAIPGLSTQIKNSYIRVILPYEHFCERSRQTPTASPIKPVAVNNALASISAPPSPLTTTSSPLSEPPDESENRANPRSPESELRRTTRAETSRSTPSSKKSHLPSSLSTPVIPLPVFNDKKRNTAPREYMCEICLKQNHDEKMLLCDGCDCGYHMFCLDPPLESIPKEEWYCFTCISGTGGDYGFDEGDEHSLSSFQARDHEFRLRWFESHPPPLSPSKANDPTVRRIGNVLVSEYDVEREFWRLVQSPDETVEVEYGADVHSTTHGSGMPTMENQPLDPYSQDPWNLNNISIVPDSLLRYIKSDISGMTVPWTYVGMTFSTFCWHNEDHYTYSMNYMHWGETKTWYGIPGDDAEKFESAIKSEAPDLFEAQPDLLFQLVTLMNPKRVSDAGVRVSACNQRAGEFVITFPKAYHAGFNHGLNFNEAVNFALPDWLPLDRDCVARYREHRKAPVFSHDELLITITQHSQSIKTAVWLLESLKEMTDREIASRTKARGLGFSEILEEHDRPEDQYQCSVCKAFCYLSQIICPCSTKVVCVDHADLLCERHGTTLTLRKRFTDDDLLSTQTKVTERADVPSSWRAKLNKQLSESAKPSLRHLRALLAEGERISYSLPELTSLRKCVSRANDWLEQANSFLIRKQGRKRPRRSRGRLQNDSSVNGLDDVDRPDRSLEELYNLLKEHNNLGFDCPEVTSLSALAQTAEGVKASAQALLSRDTDEPEDRPILVRDCERLLLDATSVNVHLHEVVEVEKLVQRDQLEEELEDLPDDISLDRVRELSTRAQACDLPDNHRLRVFLREREEAGEDWELRARKILDQPLKSMIDMNEFHHRRDVITIDPELIDRVEAFRKRAKEFEKQAQIWMDRSGKAPKPTVHEALKLVNRAEKEFIISRIQDLKATAGIASELEDRCEQVLNLQYKELDDVLKRVKTWTEYAKEHLWIFQLPNKDELQRQVEIHNKWLLTLPWAPTNPYGIQSETLLKDVLDSTRPDDDAPPTDEYYTCVCPKAVRPPPPGTQSDAVQCDHCYARFHGVCAANGGSCPFCDQHHWDGTMKKKHNFHFSLLPQLLANAPPLSKCYSDDWKRLEIIVHRVDRLSAVIGQFLSFVSQPGNQRHEYLPQVRHYMRKLYRLEFAVSPAKEMSFGLDLANIHRILATQPPTSRVRKRRRPRFTFGQDVDSDWKDGTRCICRGRVPYLLDYPTVECESCRRLYHSACVFYTGSATEIPFSCPLCCLRKNRPYPNSDIRVTALVDGLRLSNMYVDMQEMLESCSKDLVFISQSPPYKQTLFVELARFTPGDPGSSESSTPFEGMPTRSSKVVERGAPAPTYSSMHSSNASSPLPSTSNHIEPAAPAPWCRWSTMSTPSAPPMAHRRSTVDSNGSSSSLRKRKHAEEREEAAYTNGSSGSSSRSTSKRRQPAHEISGSHPSTSAAVSPEPTISRPTQTLSPSLRMIVSPTDQRPNTSSFAGSSGGRH